MVVLFPISHVLLSDTFAFSPFLSKYAGLSGINCIVISVRIPNDMLIKAKVLQFVKYPIV